MFPHIGRLDDIWASYYLQSLGYKVFYGPATVYQERNYHQYSNDFKQEIIDIKILLIYANPCSKTPS